MRSNASSIVQFSAVALIALLGLSACSSDDKIPLKGERIPVIQFSNSANVDDAADDVVMKLALMAANTSWPQQGGAATHMPGHIALPDGELQQIWRSNIGRGSAKDRKLITTPIVAGEMIFASDTDGNVGAYQFADGKRLWRINIIPKKESPVVSPGITFGNAMLYAADGVGSVWAINPENGEEIWQRNLGQPVRGAPTYQDGRLYVITLNDETIALDARNGDELWRHRGVQESAGLLGSPSPAAEGSVVITAYSSGDIIALRAETGQEAWGDNLTGASEFQSRAVTQLAGFRGHPVLDQEIAIAGNSSTRMVAVHVPSGERIWQREFGISATPWISGNTVFVITTQGALLALNRDTGLIRWTFALPRFEGNDRDYPIFWQGPILAGGRLLLVGSDGRLLEINPANGEKIRENKLAGSMMVPPIIAQNTLIIVTDNGDMVAYR